MEGSPRHWEFSILSSKVSQETSPPVGARPLQTICALHPPSTTSLPPIPGRFECVLLNRLPNAIMLHIY